MTIPLHKDDELLAALAANAQQKYEISQATSALWSTSQNRLTELTEYFIKAKKLHVEYMMAKDLNISRNATNYYYMVSWIYVIIFLFMELINKCAI